MTKGKKHREPEYRLNIYRGIDPTTCQAGWLFYVRTVKEFVSFNYEILLSGTTNERAITVQINGIHAPLMVMPGVGPAKGVIMFKDLQGEYTLHVKKLHRELNTFVLSVGTERAHVQHGPPHPFITVSVEPLEPG